jgi:hypothetical protein
VPGRNGGRSAVIPRRRRGWCTTRTIRRPENLPALRFALARAGVPVVIADGPAKAADACVFRIVSARAVAFKKAPHAISFVIRPAKAGSRPLLWMTVRPGATPSQPVAKAVALEWADAKNRKILCGR